MIGDIIHNLRSALDHVAYELVLKGGRVPSQTLAFPIRETRGQVIDSIKGELQGVVPSDIVTLIVDEIQPHRGGKGHTLWVLHRLDCIDKHRELLPAVESIGFHHIEAVDENGTTYTGVELKSVGRGELAVFPERWRTKRLQFRNEGRLTFEILLQNVDPAEGESVIPLINRLRYDVSRTIDRIAAAYGSR